jgi:hypothetical protein
MPPPSARSTSTRDVRARARRVAGCATSNGSAGEEQLHARHFTDLVERAVNRLRTAGAGTACSVEQTLAIKWEAEQEEMRRRRHPRKVMCISSTRVRELDVALARVPQGVHADATAERHLLHILKDLPP